MSGSCLSCLLLDSLPIFPPELEMFIMEPAWELCLVEADTLVVEGGAGGLDGKVLVLPPVVALSAVTEFLKGVLIK